MQHVKRHSPSRRRYPRRRFRGVLPLLCLCALLALGSRCLRSQSLPIPLPELFPSPTQESAAPYSLEDLPDYDGRSALLLSEEPPAFPESDMTSTPFERYSQQDYYGRCGPAYANVGPETMPTEERGPIGQVKPSGWQISKYDFIDGQYLYNRCHLIGYQLTAENANELNLITGTRYFNVQGMLPYENQVADYVRRTGNHVLYRVTPLYEGSDLLARGVVMEALSVEDGGAGVCFQVYAYNVQPGVEIDYATGDNRLAPRDPAGAEAEGDYILNIGSMTFHLPTCPGAGDIKEKNRQDYHGPRSLLTETGYSPCGSCRP